MSSETSAWAKEQRCGDPVTKAVLMEIANWAKPTGICEFLSVKRIAEVVEVSTRTVQRHIARLEDLDPTAGGLGMIRRVERHRDDGGQWANAFELIGYQPPLSAANSRGKAPRDRLSPPHDKMTPGDDNSDTGGVTMVSPDKEKNIIPLSTPDGVDVPPSDFEHDLLGGSPAGDGGKSSEPERAKVDGAKPHVLPDDWEPPAIADLPPEARGLVQQWPSGAYQHFAANFRDHWSSVDRKKRTSAGHAAAFRNWLRRVHPEAMRASKAGVTYAVAAPSKPAAPMKPPPPVRAKAREDGWSERVHATLKRELGDLSYAHWLKPAAIYFDAPGVVVVTNSEFARGWLEENFRSRIGAAASAANGSPVAWVRIEKETQPINRERNDRHGQG